MNPLLSFKDVSKGFEDVQILNEINIDIEPGYFYTLLGPSGCGKTTILKLIAGFEYPDSGDIIYKDKPIGKMPPNKRKVNTVFQDYALFPHLNVFDNIAYGLKFLYEAFGRKVRINGSMSNSLEFATSQFKI